MKIIKDVPRVPYVPTPYRHECEVELQRGERDHGLYGCFGMVVSCSCGIRYELRSLGFFGRVFGVGSGNCEARYWPLQYWHGLGRSASPKAVAP